MTMCEDGRVPGLVVILALLVVLYSTSPQVCPLETENNVHLCSNDASNLAG